MTLTRARVVEAPRGATPPSRPRGLTVGLMILAVGLALNALLGPLVTGIVTYPISRSVLNELLGLEVISLSIVAPMSLIVARMAWRGHPAAPLLAMGPAAYAAYILAQYVLGPQYATHPPIVLLHLTLFVISGWVLIRAWVTAREGSPVIFAATTRRRWGWALLLMAGFVASRYVPTLASIGSAEPIPGEYGLDATFYWSMLLMDLGIVVPVTVATALASWRDRPASSIALCGVVGWFALLPISVAAMAVTKIVRDDPRADPSGTVVLIVAALTFLGAAGVLLRGVLGQQRVE